MNMRPKLERRIQVIFVDPELSSRTLWTATEYVEVEKRFWRTVRVADSGCRRRIRIDATVIDSGAGKSIRREHIESVFDHKSLPRLLLHDGRSAGRRLDMRTRRETHSGTDRSVSNNS